MGNQCCGNIPEIHTGSRVHSKRLWNGTVRVGGAERYIIKYLSDYHVVVEARRGGDDSFISETVVTRREFDEEYEACPGV